MTIKRNNEVKALYIHVPFCSHICSYCDFPKIFYYPDFADKYLNTLATELNDEIKYTSIYIGGGTPSSLNSQQFARLLQMANHHLASAASFCVEVNPENCDDEKIALLVKYGVNRVSIGVQTFNQESLKYLNRAHTQGQIEILVHKLIQRGISNISCDLIYGLHNQSMEDLNNDLNTLILLPIKHISTYPLTIEEHTLFSTQNIHSAKDEVLLKMYRFINIFLKKHHFHRYEISNFAQSGYESQHNLVYWHNQNYRGVGPGASGYENGIRYSVSRKFDDYFKGIIKKEEEIVSDNDYLIEYVMLHLRTKQGISQEDFIITFGKSFEEEFVIPLTKLQQSKLITCNKKRIYLTEKGIFIENYVVGELIKHL